MTQLRSRVRVALARLARVGTVRRKGPVDGLEKAPQPFLRGLRAESDFSASRLSSSATRVSLAVSRCCSEAIC